MKLKLLPMFAGVIALTIATTPLAVKAGPSSSGQRAGLELTQEQQNRMEQIRRDANSEIEAILTPAQQKQLQAALAQGQGMSAMTSLGLSPEQRTQLQTVMQSARSKVEQILTPEQKQQLQEMRSRPQKQ